MGLSRLDNFLKSGRGTILYVDPSSIDSTDSIENSGNSLTRPFKTIQRALIEASRFSYQRGLNNDRFDKTTILVYPGDHVVDNRPGYIPTGTGTFYRRSGEVVTDLNQWDLNTNFDLVSPDNTLYKLNSIHGGVIVPRGTSIIGLDLRKTKIRPTYVPNPSEIDGKNVERSAIFRVTGGCYFWQFSIFDANPNGTCFLDYTSNITVPNFSHHKLAAFEYADGVNPVNINDTFLTYSDSIRTDLDMYYEKVARVYGPSSGRNIEPDYNEGTIDIQPVIDEYRIVGSTGKSVGISSIKSGNGVVSSNVVTVDIVEPIEGLSVNSPIQISGINVSGYDGQFVISSVLSDTQFTYKIQNAPFIANPNPTGSTVNLVVDTVTSASPYIFNVSLRSAYGLCGLLADGNNASGFKSMVVAQYTGIGLQKDDNAFVKYNTTSGEYQDSNYISNLNTDSKSKFKPSYQSFHIKATNNAFLQLVSVFAIGYSQHFVTENGGDIALNNSNSNFGATSLVASGFKTNAFPQDDKGYITHIIPPKEIENKENSVEFYSIDVGVTTSVGISTQLYLYNQTNENQPPKVLVDGYHIGAKKNDLLNIQIFENNSINTYSSRIVMPSAGIAQYSSEKIVTVGRSNVGINSIASNILTLTENHSFINGESIRVISDNGHLPDGIEPNTIYYVIINGLASNQIKLAKTLSDAQNGLNPGYEIDINNKGGILKVISRVSDKSPGDIGHPVQWNSGIGQWYINVAFTENQIYDELNFSGVALFGSSTTRSYVTRKPDSRNLVDTLYRVRYVLPKDSSGRPPVEGFILQESNDIIGNGTSEISQLFNSSGTITNTLSLRNPNFIADVSWSSNSATVTSEIPHNLNVGDQVEIVNVSPIGYNGVYTVNNVVNSKKFTYSLTLNPGLFGNNTSSRTSELPYFRRKKYNKIYQVYRTEKIQEYIKDIQDGIYYLTLINHSNYPTIIPFRDQGYSQPVDNLYPQRNNDNPESDPNAASSHVLPYEIGKVVIDDLQHSITKETLESFVVGYGITNIQSATGTSHTIFTAIDHGFSGITTVSIINQGAEYGSTSGFTGSLYNARLVGFAGSLTGENATAKITVTSGAITGVKIINGGSSYGIGNTLAVVGVATTSNHVIGVVRVESITNNIGDTLKVSGITLDSDKKYNTLYRISGVNVGKAKEINVVSSDTISGHSTTGIGSTSTLNSSYTHTGKSLLITSLNYNSNSGIATVGFSTNHGLQVNNKIIIRGANESVFNGDFIVNKLNSLESLTVNIGIATTSTTATGTLYAYRPALTSYSGTIDRVNEIKSGRLIYEYGGITGYLGAQYVDTSSSDLIIPNAVSLGFNLGDYILINNEIFRISSDVSSNNVSALRAVLGSYRQTHDTGSVIRKIIVHPVEFRRNSIIRASGHTFEYLGYGAGNYSTSLPEKQDRILTSSEKFLAQSSKIEGGIIVYTGMDSEGNFYAGNKKINSATGKEESYDTPIPTYTGETEIDSLVNITETQKLFVTDSIKVEGGIDKTKVSEFEGPAIFRNKVTVQSDIESDSIYLQGTEEISRKYTISDSKPTVNGNYGDIVFNSEPSKNDFMGWTYVTENRWESFGFIGQQGVGISSNGQYVGFSTLLNLVATGFTFGITRDSNTGISTITFDNDPRVAIYTGANSTNFLGRVKSLNFIGGGVTVTGGTDVGIATIILDKSVINGSSPNEPYYSLQWNDDDSFGGQNIGFYDPELELLRFGNGPGSSIFDSIFFNETGLVGFGSTQPTSKLDIISDNMTSLSIKKLGSNDVIKIQDRVTNRTQFVIDGEGRVGVNTDSPLSTSHLDVNGSVSIAGTFRIYETDRTNFVGFKVESLSSDLIYTLPTSYGSNGQVLSSNGSGGLTWRSVSNQELVTSQGSGINITYSTVGSGITIATISNTGVRSLSAGSGISLSGNTGDITITATRGTSPFPFTTPGFSQII
jgi:hypothetical protein